MRLIEQLLIQISRRVEDPHKADQAFKELYSEYGHVVHDACVFVCKGFGITRKQEVEDLEQEVWIKIFLSAKTFQPKPSIDAAEEERRFFAWLATVAKNIRRQEFRKSIQLLLEPTWIALTESVPQLVMERPKSIEDEIEEDIFEILHSLSALESEVMRTTLEHPKKVPTSEIKRIMLAFNTSAGNIRQIRKRVLARIKKVVLTKYHSVSYTTNR